MDAYGHAHANVTACFLRDYLFFGYHGTLNINSYSLIIQYSLNAVGYILLHIAVYEFICAQSPLAMKGLVIGTFFAIKGSLSIVWCCSYNISAICNWLEHYTYTAKTEV